MFPPNSQIYVFPLKCTCNKAWLMTLDSLYYSPHFFATEQMHDSAQWAKISLLLAQGQNPFQIHHLLGPFDFNFRSVQFYLIFLIFEFLAQCASCTKQCGKRARVSEAEEEFSSIICMAHLLMANVLLIFFLTTRQEALINA